MEEKTGTCWEPDKLPKVSRFVAEPSPVSYPAFLPLPSHQPSVQPSAPPCRKPELASWARAGSLPDPSDVLLLMTGRPQSTTKSLMFHLWEDRVLLTLSHAHSSGCTTCSFLHTTHQAPVGLPVNTAAHRDRPGVTLSTSPVQA